MVEYFKQIFHDGLLIVFDLFHKNEVDLEKIEYPLGHYLLQTSNYMLVQNLVLRIILNDIGDLVVAMQNSKLSNLQPNHLLLQTSKFTVLKKLLEIDELES